jgi:hypothetical protein
MTVVLVHVNYRNFLKAVRGSYHPFVIKHALFPLGTMSLLVSCSGLCGVCVKISSNMPNFLPHHLGGMTLHQARCHLCLIFFNFLECKCHGTPCMCPGRETNMFVNSFQFTTHRVNLHTSTQNMIFQTVMVSCCM